MRGTGKSARKASPREGRPPAESRPEMCCGVRPGAAARKCADGSPPLWGQECAVFAANVGGTTEVWLSSLWWDESRFYLPTAEWASPFPTVSTRSFRRFCRERACPFRGKTDFPAGTAGDRKGRPYERNGFPRQCLHWLGMTGTWDDVGIAPYKMVNKLRSYHKIYRWR